MFFNRAEPERSPRTILQAACIHESELASGHGHVPQVFVPGGQDPA